QRLRDLAGETLDEVHATLRPDLDDPARNLAVIDGTREVVGHGRAREVHRELDVDREPHADGLLGGGDAVMTVEAHVVQAQPIGSHSFTTGFLREPTPSTRISTRSPGRSVMTSDTRATRSSTGKIRSLVEPSGQNVSNPLARAASPSRARTSRAVTSLSAV